MQSIKLLCKEYEAVGIQIKRKGHPNVGGKNFKELSNIIETKLNPTINLPNLSEAEKLISRDINMSHYNGLLTEEDKLELQLKLFSVMIGGKHGQSGQVYHIHSPN